LRSINYAVQAARIREYDQNVRAVLSALIGAVVNSMGAPWDEIAVRYFIVRGIPFQRRLFRVAAVRAGADVAEATHPTRIGEGIVGTAVAHQETIAIEWRRFVQAATDQGPSEWAARPTEKRYGLSWGQLRRSLQPPGIVAVPTFDPRGRPNGCIMISGPLKLNDLKNEAMQEALEGSVTALDRLGSPPPGWWNAHER
jgi:hypothetical protein